MTLEIVNIDRLKKPTCLLLHVVPWDGIGGVEVAARLSAEQSGGLVRVHSLGRSVHPDGAGKWVSQGRSRNPLSALTTLDAMREIRRRRPPVVVFSLWRTLFAFLATKMFFPHIKTVLFLHCSISVHLADRIATAIMLRLADEVWADSPTTLKGRAKGRYVRSRVISMLLHTPRQHLNLTKPRHHGARVVSWCRLSKEKGLHKAIQLIGELKRRGQEVSFTVIGPDLGMRESLVRLASELGVDREVQFTGPQNRKMIEAAAANATFYLQLSDHEGMAMAVVEAMQLGLIPVVTPVGMIPEYCFDRENAVIFTDFASTAERVERLLSTPQELVRLARAAHSQFADAKLYTVDVLEAAQSLSGSSGGSNSE